MLVARRSRDSIIARRQAFTRAWWRVRDDFERFTSWGVRDEAALGDPREVQKRLAVIRLMRAVAVTTEAEQLAGEILAKGILPEKARTDAIHLATAMVHGIQVVLRWNFRHLANVDIVVRISRWAKEKPYNVPVITTPEVLLGSLYEE